MHIIADAYIFLYKKNYSYVIIITNIYIFQNDFFAKYDEKAVNDRLNPGWCCSGLGWASLFWWRSLSERRVGADAGSAWQ